jgi:hypothetical protein
VRRAEAFEALSRVKDGMIAGHWWSAVDLFECCFAEAEFR